MRGVAKALSWSQLEKDLQTVTDWRSPVKEHHGKTRLEVLWMCTDRRSVEECWYWTGYIRNDYPMLRVAGTQHRVNRLMWMIIHKADILPGEYILHTCDNPGCVNPYHLYKGDQTDNMQDRIARGRVPSGWTNDAVRKRVKAYWDGIPVKDRHKRIINKKALK